MVFDRLMLVVILLWFLYGLVFLGLLGKLLWTRLVAVYPWLTLFLIADILEQVARVAFHEQQVAVYRAGDLALLALAVVVMWELVRRGFQEYAALSAFIRKASWGMVGISVVVSFLNWSLDPALPAGRSALLQESLAMIRAGTSGLLAYLFLVIGFVGWFPVRMRRNVAVLLTGFVAYFAATWVNLLANNLPSGNSNWVNLFKVGVQAGCAVAWLLLLDRGGEEAEIVTGHRWNPAEMNKLSRKLDAINTSLVRMGQ